ncbi:hypothetical protein CTA2_11129 [Colletotrichum tanaceti]|uniref:Uncharacterized protein n=1 Tax=Colletotrichum tanaceti TaxID=1306861 RepID=A0A4U6XGH0_9PEZI|nr:hypothetical protein CTA2_11129 [Colletotrichum tanaceti]TKW54479.1 hypothetical protein CTA1_5023 [Colletotrichum tanaceti]
MADGDMDELGIILLTLFMFLLVCGPMYRPICLAYMWAQDHRKYHPRTSQLHEARRKLSTVSECTSVGLEKSDLESGLHQTDAEPEREWWRGFAWRWRWRGWKKSPVETDAKPFSDDDVLTLKSCKHNFHAKFARGEDEDGTCTGRAHVVGAGAETGVGAGEGRRRDRGGQTESGQACGYAIGGADYVK